MTPSQIRSLLAGTLSVLLALAGWMPLLAGSDARAAASQGWESKQSPALSLAWQQEEARKAPKPWPALEAVTTEAAAVTRPLLFVGTAPVSPVLGCPGGTVAPSLARGPPRG